MTGFNSTRCPYAASVILSHREVFGDDVRVLHVRENGIERGEEPEHGQQVAMPPTRGKTAK